MRPAVTAPITFIFQKSQHSFNPIISNYLNMLVVKLSLNFNLPMVPHSKCLVATGVA